MTTLPVVRAGQVWEDNDKRSQGRRVQVLRVFTQRERTKEAKRAHRFDPDAYVDVLYAECVVVADRAGPRSVGRRVVIRCDRFRPTSTGYKLVQEAPGG